MPRRSQPCRDLKAEPFRLRRRKSVKMGMGVACSGAESSAVWLTWASKAESGVGVSG